jgi:hypothetical protein
MARLGENALSLLVVLVNAFETPHPARGTREPLDFFRVAGGGKLQHHALPAHFDRAVGETDLEELSYAGLLDIDYRNGNWRLAPTPDGSQVVRDYQVAQDTELRAPADHFLTAAAEQAEDANPLAWARVRELLIGLREHWQASGFPADGIQMRPLVHALPTDHEANTDAGLRALLFDGYIEARSDIEISGGIPALVALTPKAFQALDGWPSENPTQLYGRLIAAIEAQEKETTDPARKRRLKKAGESMRELGVSTASEVLAKVITGGV